MGQQQTNALPGQTSIPDTGVPEVPADAEVELEDETPPAAAVAPAAPAPRPVKPSAAVIKIPQAAFKERVRREAQALVRAELGADLSEVKTKLATPASNNDEALAAANREAQKAAKKVIELENSVKTWEAKHRKDTRRLRDRQIEADLRFRASKAGIIDPEYALHLFARKAAVEASVDPDKFFAGLKTAPWNSAPAAAPAVPPAPPKPPAPVPVPATTAPPESLSPGEERPEPNASATQAPPPNVEQMSPQEFSRYARSQYGFQSGA